MRSTPPIHNSRSGLTGFFTSTGISCPRSASAISCMANGLAVVRAPIQIMSMSPSNAARTCLRVATSVAVYIPVSRFTRCSRGQFAGCFDYLLFGFGAARPRDDQRPAGVEPREIDGL